MGAADDPAILEIRVDLWSGTGAGALFVWHASHCLLGPDALFGLAGSFTPPQFWGLYFALWHCFDLVGHYLRLPLIKRMPGLPERDGVAGAGLKGGSLPQIRRAGSGLGHHYSLQYWFYLASPLADS